MLTLFVRYPVLHAVVTPGGPRVPPGFRTITRIMEPMRLIPFLLAVAAAVPAAAQQPPADSARVYELHEVEVLPRPQNAADFAMALRDAYPAHLRASRVEGAVQVAFIVGPDGVPHSARVAESTEPGFDSVTVASVGVLRFAPATVAGRPVAVHVVQPVQWRLPPPEPVASSCDADFCGTGASPAPTPGNPIDGYELSEVEELPRPVNSAAFGELLARSFPAPLRDAGVSGVVQVRFRVEADGTTTNHRITHSSNRGFDAATVSALRELRFRPARLNGQAVRVWVEQPIIWRVAGPAPRLEEDRRDRTDQPMFGRPRP